VSKVIRNNRAVRHIHVNTLKAGLQDNRALRSLLFMQSQENIKGAENNSEDTRDWLRGGKIVKEL
jgi:hypothetical protein